MHVAPLWGRNGTEFNLPNIFAGQFDVLALEIELHKRKIGAVDPERWRAINTSRLTRGQ